MFVFKAENINPGILRSFLEQYECRCVQLCEFARKNEPDIYVFSKSNKIDSESDVFGVAYIDSTVLHCFPFLDSGKANEDFDRAFLSAIMDKKRFSTANDKKTGFLNGKTLGFITNKAEAVSNLVFCVNGEKSASEYIIRLLEKHGKKIYQKKEFYLMSKIGLAELPFPTSLLCMGEELVWCRENSADDLFELQKQYLMEEVVPKGLKAKNDAIKSNVEKILKEQKVFAIAYNGRFLAKANTNAIGWNWMQLGGVFTMPFFRRRKYALCLVSALCRHINENGGKTCLFVNKSNIPAFSLYKKLGFTTECEFVICYFE